MRMYSGVAAYGATLARKIGAESYFKRYLWSLAVRTFRAPLFPPRTPQRVAAGDSRRDPTYGGR
jgi:hypothetical protein